MTAPVALPPVRATWACAKCHAAVRGLRAMDGAPRDRVVRLAPGLYLGDARGRTIALAGEAALPLSRAEARRVVAAVRAGRVWPDAVVVRRRTLARLATAQSEACASGRHVSCAGCPGCGCHVGEHAPAPIASSVVPEAAELVRVEGAGGPALVGPAPIELGRELDDAALRTAVMAWASGPEAHVGWAACLRLVTAAYWRGLWARARRVSAMARLAGVSRRAAYAAVARAGLWEQAGGVAMSAPAAEGEG